MISLKKPCTTVSEFFRRSLLGGSALLMLAICMANSAFAVPPAVTLPADLPSVDAAINLAIVALGVTVAVVIGGYFGFVLIMKGMRWGRRALG